MRERKARAGGHKRTRCDEKRGVEKSGGREENKERVKGCPGQVRERER